jgi:chaperone required for assembly of F1-ATPase
LMEKRISAEEAFAASQVDETFQIEQWGEDAEAIARRASLRADILATRRYLDLVRG